MNSTIFFLGPRDTRYGGFTNARSSGDKAVRFSFEGCLPLTKLFEQDATIKKHSIVIVGGYHNDVSIRPDARVNFFNLMADAEACTWALELADKMAAMDGVVRVFNPPALIRATTRQNAPQLFAGIAGLVVPKVAVLEPGAVDRRLTALETLSLNYPLLIRTAGWHGGSGLTRVQDRQQLESRLRELDPDKRVLLTEFVDTRTADGLEQKARIAFVDGRYYLRHYMLSREWPIHARSRQNLQDHSEAARQPERVLFDNFPQSLSTRQQAVLSEMHKRMRLDVWGLDCAFMSNGDIVLYEANACMDFLSGATNKVDYPYLPPARAQIEAAIKAMIVSSR